MALIVSQELSDTLSVRADQNWNVTLTSWVQQEGGKYSWHTNRKWLEPPHNRVSCPPPPHHTIPHFSLTHLRLWSFCLILLLPVTPTLKTFWKQEVINQWSVPLKGKQTLEMVNVTNYCIIAFSYSSWLISLHSQNVELYHKQWLHY